MTQRRQTKGTQGEIILVEREGEEAGEEKFVLVTWAHSMAPILLAKGYFGHSGVCEGGLGGRWLCVTVCVTET